MKYKLSVSLVALTVLNSISVQASVATFDDLPLAAESFFSSNVSTAFTSANATFEHNCSIFGGTCFWNGFSYSNTSDTTTPGFTNQYSAITGGGVNGSSNFGVGFSDSARVSFSEATLVDGAYFTNTTYAFISMRDGDGFAKQFAAGDFFTLTVNGLDDTNTITHSVDVELAVGTNLLDSWLWTDLSSLGNVFALEFSFASSDVGAFGINTPTYFAIDDLTSAAVVPVPAAVWLFGSGLIGLIGIARRK